MATKYGVCLTIAGRMAHTTTAGRNHRVYAVRRRDSKRDCRWEEAGCPPSPHPGDLLYAFDCDGITLYTAGDRDTLTGMVDDLILIGNLVNGTVFTDEDSS